MKRDKALELGAKRREILALPPENALEAILDHPYPVTLVQSMAEEDFLILIHNIGPDDALPILGMASNSQWEYVLDMETWTRDRIDPRVITQWFDRLMRADADRFTHWIVSEQTDLFRYYLNRHIQVLLREHDQEVSDIGDDFFTEDNVHYVRLRPLVDSGLDSDADNPHEQEMRDTFLKDLLKRIAVYDYPIYQAFLLESSVIIAAESEEELLRLRNVRLAEKGFLPFEEAVGVYQPLTVEQLYQRDPKPAAPGGRAVDTYPLTMAKAGGRAPENRFARIVSNLQDEAALQRLQMEFAGLCNQVIAADQKKITEKEVLSQIVDKVAGYISIGLEQADHASEKADPYRGAKLVLTYLLADIFRVGYGCALRLKWQAERWRQASWFGRVGLPLSFWGEAWLGVLGGLLIKKPLFFDNYASGVLYREFATLADIHRTERRVERIIAFDDLIALMGIELPRFKANTFLTYQNLLLTLWAGHELQVNKDARVLQPLSLTQLKAFYSRLWEAGQMPRRIKEDMRERFLNWLAEQSGLAPHEISERMGASLEDLFRLVENELGAVVVEDLDSRYVQLFLLSPIIE